MWGMPTRPSLTPTPQPKVGVWGRIPSYPPYTRPVPLCSWVPMVSIPPVAYLPPLATPPHPQHSWG